MPNWSCRRNLIDAEFRALSLSITIIFGIPNAINVSLSGTFISSAALDFKIFTWAYFENLSLFVNVVNVLYLSLCVPYFIR